MYNLCKSDEISYRNLSKRPNIDKKKFVYKTSEISETNITDVKFLHVFYISQVNSSKLIILLNKIFLYMSLIHYSKVNFFSNNCWKNKKNIYILNHILQYYKVFFIQIAYEVCIKSIQKTLRFMKQFTYLRITKK